MPLNFKIFASTSGNGMYRVAAERNGSNAKITCTCPGYQGAHYCKHIFDLLAGDIENLASGNVSDVESLAKIVKDSDVSVAMEKLREAEANEYRAREAVYFAKQALGKALST